MFFLKKKFAEYKVLFGTLRLKLDASTRSIVQLYGTWSVRRIKGSVKCLDPFALISTLNVNAQCERDNIRTGINMTSDTPTYDKHNMIIHIYTTILNWFLLKNTRHNTSSPSSKRSPTKRLQNKTRFSNLVSGSRPVPGSSRIRRKSANHFTARAESYNPFLSQSTNE
jgi:hypothetical protein